jgi:two-component system chemotaxis sensor kinase CheA
VSDDNHAVNLSSLEEIKKEFSSDDFFVLHIEDEELQRLAFYEDLAEIGIKVLSAANGNEAFEILRERHQKIVLIVSDFKMPGLDGFQVREKALQQFPEIPFCIVSAFVNRESALKGVELKIAAFISKPIRRQELAHVIVKEALPRLRAVKEDLELTLAFIADTETLIEESESILLRLEGPSDPEDLNRFYAIMHTIKGGAGFCEPKFLHHFVHAYEDVLKKLQTGELAFGPAISTILFSGFDTIKALFDEIKQGKTCAHELDSLLACLSLSHLREDGNGRHASLSTSGGQAGTTGRSRPTAQEDIKVSVKLLDEFMQLSGEVTVIRNMLNKCVSSIERKYAGDRDVGMLTDLLAELHKINSGVQNKITEIRKVPLKSVMRVLPRAVRDVTKSLNKKAELLLSGDELRVDASIADVLHNCLLHIIKNSIDHGIESTETRTKSGKNPSGIIKVDAAIRDERVIVKITDDGAGLNVDAIKNKLIKNGMYTKPQIDQMSNTDLYGMIFSSGFSTAQQVTEISGRGVGMSMVKDCVDAIGGQIVITSEDGKGACFQLELPVPKSILIANCLSVKIGDWGYSLVRDDIVRVVQLNQEQAREQIMPIDQSEFLIFEGELVPIVDLNHLLCLEQENIRPSDLRRLVLMTSGKDSRYIATEVTEILDVEDMVIKNLHNALNKDSLFRGVTFLDNGGVGLILSTEGIMNSMKISSRRKKVTNPKGDEKSQSQGLQDLRARNALTIKLFDTGHFAISQQEIFRIEEINTSSLQKSGTELVIPYRNTIMRVVSLSNLMCPFELAGTNVNLMEDSPSQMLPIVVVKSNSSYVGISVDQIMDMVSVGDVKTDLAQAEKGIEGHFFVGDSTFALLNLNHILAKVLPPQASKELGAEIAPVQYVAPRAA